MEDDQLMTDGTQGWTPDGATGGAQNGTTDGSSGGAQEGAQEGAQDGTQYGTQDGTQDGTPGGAQARTGDGGLATTGGGPILYARTPEGRWIMQASNGSRYRVYDDNGYLHGHAYDGDMPEGASEAEPPELFPSPPPLVIRDIEQEWKDRWTAQNKARVYAEMRAAGVWPPRQDPDTTHSRSISEGWR